MKFNSKLWMLAVAMATVGCQDDLVDGGGTTTGVDEARSTAKVNVAISTETTTKVATKATAGENGEGVDKAEVGSPEEYTVKDVTLILYSKAEGTSDWKIEADSKLVAAGWTDQVGVMETSDATTGTPQTFPNSRMTTVEVSIKDNVPSLASEQGTEYGVIAVTNLGQTKGEALVAEIKKTSGGYSTVADLDKALYSNYTDGVGHVMSTHAIDGSEGASQVTFTTNQTAIPSTTVYVERLSAKIRLTADATHSNFKYTVASTMVDAEGSTSQVNDEITLNNVAIVNQLKSGSFLLKRVAGLDEEGADLNEDSSEDEIIGDETAASGYGTNFVIDPWTRSKTETNLASFPTHSASSTKLDYTNVWKEASLGSLWGGYSTVAINSDNFDAEGHLQLCYTQENTFNIANSLNGYTTGALFQATYYPARWMALVESGENKGDVDATTITYTETGEEGAKVKTPETFYTYASQGIEYIFEDYDAILGYVIGKAGQEGVSYYSFTKTGESLSSSFGTDIAKLRSYANNDPFGYISAMVAEYDKAQEATEDAPYTAKYVAIDEYLDDYTAALAGTSSDITLDDDAKATFYERVKTYTYRQRYMRYRNTESAFIEYLREESEIFECAYYKYIENQSANKCRASVTTALAYQQTKMEIEKNADEHQKHVYRLSPCVKNQREKHTCQILESIPRAV